MTQSGHSARRTPQVAIVIVSRMTSRVLPIQNQPRFISDAARAGAAHGTGELEQDDPDRQRAYVEPERATMMAVKCWQLLFFYVPDEVEAEQARAPTRDISEGTLCSLKTLGSHVIH